MTLSIDEKQDAARHKRLAKVMKRPVVVGVLHRMDEDCLAVFFEEKAGGGVVFGCTLMPASRFSPRIPGVRVHDNPRDYELVYGDPFSAIWTWCARCFPGTKLPVLSLRMVPPE